MKISLQIGHGLVARLRAEARKRGTNMSRLVEDALHLYLGIGPIRPNLRPLPSFDAGRPLVDVDDRDALERAMAGNS